MRKNVYILSDAHLGSLAIEHGRTQERRLVRFLDEIKDKAAAIYLLGDMFDFWYEYKYVVPKGYTRFLGKLSELTDMGVEVHFFTGNHDIWIFDYLPGELGVEVVQKECICTIDGKKFFLAHGDGVGNRKWTFRALRWIFHNKTCQKLYASIHPRWTIPFAKGWSKSSRAKDSYPEYLGEGKEYLEQFAQSYADESIDFFVFGHRHIMLDKPINAKSRIIILGDWIHFCSYAVFDGKEMQLKKYI